MGVVNEVIHRASAEATVKARMEKLIAFNVETFERAATYDNIIMIGGYAAFFTVWTGVTPHIGRAPVLWAGGLICVSLALYVFWHIYQMSARYRAQRRFAAVIEQNDVSTFDRQWHDAEIAYKRDMSIVLSRWLFVFVPSVVTGLAAAVVLSGAIWSGIASSG